VAFISRKKKDTDNTVKNYGRHSRFLRTPDLSNNGEKQKEKESKISTNASISPFPIIKITPPETKGTITTISTPITNIKIATPPTSKTQLPATQNLSLATTKRLTRRIAPSVTNPESKTPLRPIPKRRLSDPTTKTSTTKLRPVQYSSTKKISTDIKLPVLKKKSITET